MRRTFLGQCDLCLCALKKVLHIGDNLATDYCGARAAGFQALLLDRSDDARVVAYQVSVRLSLYI